jgi:predicted small secreted protein
MTGLQHCRRRFAAALVSGLVLAGGAGVLSACNTISGAGQDISATGNAITGGADKTKKALPPAPKPSQY